MSCPIGEPARPRLPLLSYNNQETNPGALLFVLMSTKDSEVEDEKLNNWYDNHAPLRLSCPGFLTAARYRAVDRRLPEWLATYEMKSADVLDSESYHAQGLMQPSWEAQMLRDLAILERRVFRLVSRKTAADYDERRKQGHVMKTVGLDVSDGLEVAELDLWYEEEHVPLLSSVPGWLRSSRWQLVDAKRAINMRRNANENSIPQFIAIHEWDSMESFNHPEWQRATSTEWRNSIMERKGQDTEERRTWQLYKNWK